MLEYINSAACFVLLLYSLPVAMAVGNRGMWFQRLSMVAVQIGLFLQMTTPWVGWMPQATWTAVYLNAAAAVMITIWWRRAWAFVKGYLGPDIAERRRRTDRPPELHQPVVHRYPWSGTPKA